MVEVTQAIRDAVADYFDATDDDGMKYGAYRRGQEDNHPLVQMIAGLVIAERERCARVADGWAMDWTRESAHIPSDIAQALRSTQ